MAPRRTTRSRSSVASESSTTTAPARAPPRTKAADGARARRRQQPVDDSDDDDDGDELESVASYEQANKSSTTGTTTPRMASSPANRENVPITPAAGENALSLLLSPQTSVRNSLRRLTLQQSTSPDRENTPALTQVTPKPAAAFANQSKPSPLGEVSLARQNVAVVGLNPVENKPASKAVARDDDSRPVVETIMKETAPSPQEPKRRLVITHLVLNNFKSYAGRQEIGPFHSSFSAVVGPNGSGKSNVIDSLLFVFGFRASKMRQAKVSALIHNSAQHPDLAFCSVEVHFQNVVDNENGTTTAVPDSKLVVCRRAYKNNTSKYSINDRDSNYGEVTSLLRERGIDLDHKRFLILQGEVESIAQMKPKAQNENDDGLLEYLEDIIGTSKYKKPIEESAKEVEALNEICHEKVGRLDIVQKEKSSLEDARKAALKYIHDENELTMKRSALFQLYVANCLENIQVTEELLASLATQLEQELENNKGNEDEIDSLNSQYKDAAKDLENLQSQAKAAAKTLAKHERDAVQLTEKKKHIIAKKEKLTKVIASSKLSISSSSGWMTNYDEEMEKLTGEIAELKRDLQAEQATFEEIKTSLEGKTRGISDEIEKKKMLLEPWNQKINTKVSELDVTKSELRILSDKRAADEQAIAAQEEKIKTVISNGQAKEKALDDLKTELAHVEDQIRHGEIEWAAAASALDSTRERVSIVRQQAEDARQQFAASQSQGKVLNSLMRLNDSGRISGFYGRLGNLGTIDERFDVAISTACPALNNLVVDSVETGQACIEYLRKNDIGRAMFILLDKLPQRDMSDIQTPENAPRLFDLVKPKDPKFAQAFYSVLHDTLVANDMAQANRIAFGKKRWRVVTLDGKLIDMSGTMSGGGSKVSKGLMRNKLVQGISETALQQVEADYAQSEQEFAKEQAMVNEMEDALKDLKKRKPKVELSISKTELEIQALGTHLLDAKKMLNDLKAELASNSAQDKVAKTLANKLAGIENEIVQLREKSSTIENEVNDLEEKIMEIGGVKLRVQKSKVDGILQQIEIRNDRISNTEMAKAKAEKDSAKQSKSVNSAETELAEVEVELQSVHQDLANVENAAHELEHASNQAAFVVEERQEKLKEMKEDLDERMKEINAFRKSEIDIRNKIESHEKDLRENKKRLKHWSEKLSTLSLHDAGDEQPLDLPVYSEDELGDVDKDVLKAEIALLEEKSDKARVDLTVLEEYRRREQEFETRNADLKDTVSQRDTVKHRYEDLRKRRLEEFMNGFSQISVKLKEMYQMITMGGNAELELVDSLDPFSEGILFSVMPPKKSWKNISNLSGGEKTLSSLALVFALHHFKPTPLYVMDEIDAALDFRNVSIVANYIKERTKNAQFVVISLRNNMFELAKQLVGIYKVNHMTKSITIENRELEEVIGR
ncbi:RecF/RecN/SMC [Lipomyces tetrasporus]